MKISEKIREEEAYLLFVTDTTDGVCVKKIARCKFFRFNAKNWRKLAKIGKNWQKLAFFGANFGVKKMTIMRYVSIL